MTELSRSLSLPLVVCYGLGTILGARVYVLVGVVAGEAGHHAPLSFVAAGVIAGGIFPRAHAHPALGKL